MEKLIFKAIDNKKETELVLEKIENYSGVRLPLSYTANSKIVGAFLHDKLVAGYILVTKPNFRSLMFVPDKIKRENSFFKKDEYQMMEINGLWLGPALKSPSLQVRVWLELIKDIFMCKKKYVLLMRNTNNKKMEKFLNMSNPTYLYDGPPLLMAGQNSHNKIQVSYTTRWSIILSIHRVFSEYRSRQLRSKRFETKHSYSQPLKHANRKLAQGL